MMRITIEKAIEVINSALADLVDDESDLYWALFDAKEFAERSFEDVDEKAWDTVRHTVLDILGEMEGEE